MALWQAVQRYDVRSHNNALKRFTTRNRSIVGGKRTEKGKNPGRKAFIDYFGNVQTGDGEIHPDIDLGAELDFDGDPDDDAGDCYLDHVDHRLEDVRGDGYWEWITRHMGERDRRMVLLRRDGASLDFIAKAEGMHLETVRRLVLNALKCSPIFHPPRRLRVVQSGSRRGVCGTGRS
jgi:hypothetical protein